MDGAMHTGSEPYRLSSAPTPRTCSTGGRGGGGRAPQEGWGVHHEGLGGSGMPHRRTRGVHHEGLRVGGRDSQPVSLKAFQGESLFPWSGSPDAAPSPQSRQGREPQSGVGGPYHDASGCSSLRGPEASSGRARPSTAQCPPPVRCRNSPGVSSPHSLLAELSGSWDLSSLSRDGTQATAV